MAKFKAGDKVRNTRPRHNEEYQLVRDWVYTVYAANTGCTELVETPGAWWLSDGFEIAREIVDPLAATQPALAPVSEAARRKGQPVTSGVLDYFPDALLAVSEVSRAGNEQHHPGKPLHWEKDKSTDHAECVVRHLLDRGTLDTDGSSHTAKVAWRALALLQTELESRDPALAARRQAQRDAAAKGERK